MRKLCLLSLFAFFLSDVNGQPGSLDQTFGNMGIQTTAFLNNSNSLDEQGRVVLTSANGNIFVVAQLTLNPWYTRIVKYLPGGRLDSSYGNMGYSNTANLNVTSAAIQGDTIILAGSISNAGTGDDFGVARYTPDGVLDTSFGVNGVVKTDFNNSSDDHANSIVLHGGKIIVGGHTYDNFNGNTDFALARYTADGILDSTFAENGKIRTDFNNSSDDRANVIALQGNKIILAGYTYIFASSDYYDFALARYTADGRLDSSFGENGKVSTDFNNSDDRANVMALQGDKIVLAGYTENSVGFYFDFVLARYTAEGVLDAAFRKNGIVTTDFINSFDRSNSIALQGDKILVSGFCSTRRKSFMCQ